MEKREMGKYYKFTLYIIVVILINLVGLNLFFRTDLTTSGLYSLSDASEKAVSSLKEPLTINVFFSKNLPAPHNNTERYLHDLLEEYEIHANDYLSYRFYDVSAKEGDLSESAVENRKIAQNYGIHPVNVQKIERDEAKVQRAYMGMVFIHGNVVERIQAITSTEGLEYKITNTIQKMNNKISALLDLPEKIKIVLVQSSSLTQIASVVKLKGLSTLRGIIQNTVNDLNSKNYNQLEFVVIDPTSNPEIENRIKNYTRFGLQWPELKTVDGRVIPAGKGILAIGVEYGGKSVERELLTKEVKLTSRGFEEQFLVVDINVIKTFIDENIDNLIDINEDLGYLSSHGTLMLSQNLPPQLRMMQQQQQSQLNNFNSIVSKGYTVKQVNLKDDEIPESIDTLIIAGAKENFSEWELFQIDQFLMKGKSLAIFMDAFNEIQQRNRRQMYGYNQPVYLPLNTGLEKLLSFYGLKVKKSYVMDESCYINRDRRSGEMPYYFAPIIKNEKINHDPDFMENIKQLVVIKASPIEVDEEKVKKNDLKLERLFSSTDRSWEMSGRINLMPWAIKPPASDKDKKSIPLAYILEGEFTSYFADKPVPEKPKKEDDKEKDEGDDKKDKKEKAKEKPVIKESGIKEEKAVLSKGRRGKIFIVGSSEILKDNVVDGEGYSPNAVFVLNTIDYLNNNEGTAVMRSKNQRFNPLKDTKLFTRRFVKFINIGGLPALVIFFGVIIWVRRKARRKVIQTMFKK